MKGIPVFFAHSLPADVLGHPFGKVPPSQPFDGCTSSEAEVILSDPSNPVGKKLLAGEWGMPILKWVTVQLCDGCPGL